MSKIKETDIKNYRNYFMEINGIKGEMRNLCYISDVPENFGSNPNFNTKSPQEKIMHQLESLIEKKNDKIKELLTLADEIEDFLSILGPEMRVIMRLTYMDINEKTGRPYTFEEIGEKMFMHRKTVSRMVREFWDTAEKVKP